MKQFKTILIGVVLLAGLNLCQKGDDVFQSKGVITGQDIRACAAPCCGGWYIVIDNKTYEFNTLPDGSGIDLNTATFPISIELDWKTDSTINCSDYRITVLRAARIK
jgi:hypothetical protein